jgi:hypothetical protein
MKNDKHGEIVNMHENSEQHVYKGHSRGNISGYERLILKYNVKKYIK